MEGMGSLVQFTVSETKKKGRRCNILLRNLYLMLRVSSNSKNYGNNVKKKNVYIFAKIMRTDDILKIKAVLLYIIQNSNADRHDVYSIVKTAYYAQQIHFAKWALPIYKDKIAALPFGPVPSTIYDILKVSRGETSIERFYKGIPISLVTEAIGFEYESFIAKENADINFLSISEIECLNEAIAKVASMNFAEIKNDTHGQEWKRAFNDPCHFMDNIAIAKEGGADDSIVDYLMDTLVLEEVLG